MNEINDITLSELISLLNEYNEEVSCDGKTISSHNFKSRVYFTIEDSDIDVELTEVELDRLFGCGCACGVTFRLKICKK